MVLIIPSIAIFLDSSCRFVYKEQVRPHVLEHVESWLCHPRVSGKSTVYIFFLPQLASSLLDNTAEVMRTQPVCCRKFETAKA